MQIYDVLKADHEYVLAQVGQLIDMNEDASHARRKELVEMIRDALVPHSRAEEAVLYNSLREIPDARGLVAHSYQEHLEAETLLRTLQLAEKVDAGWRATAQKLQSALQHHIHTEEGEVFDAAKRVFTAEESETMAEAFSRLKPEIQEEGLMTTTAELVANLMPPRFAGAFRRFNLSSRV